MTRTNLSRLLSSQRHREVASKPVLPALPSHFTRKPLARIVSCIVLASSLTMAVLPEPAMAATPSFTEQTGAANPFASLTTTTNATLTLMDIDGDGDLDVMVGSQANVLYHENTGSAIAPAFIFRPGINSPFFGVYVTGYNSPALSDVDGDGDLDIVIGDVSGVFDYGENTGSVTMPDFIERTGMANLFNTVDVGTKAKPAFADLDGDGDFDMVSGENSFNDFLNYFENTGSAITPAFVLRAGSANPLDGSNSFFDSTPTLGDVDGDGDLDAVVGGNVGTLLYFENTGSATAPAFIQRANGANPFNGVDVGADGGDSAPTLADVDGDGDLDVMVGTNDGPVRYFKNNRIVATPEFTERNGTDNPFNGFDLIYNSAPTLTDVDGDGDLDMVAGENTGNLHYFENTGNATAPAFVQRTGAANPVNAFNPGYNSTPTYGDVDGDGDMDMLVGVGSGTFNYFENTGNAIAPAFVGRTGGANPFSGLSVGDYSYNSSTLMDIDGDGDLDLVVGEANGPLNYFENTGTAIAPAFVERTDMANPFNGISVGILAAPTLTDVDGDGDFDVVSGENTQGAVNYLENTGTANVPAFVLRAGSANPFDAVNVGGYAKPTLADIDGDGDLDAVVGGSYGDFTYFENTSVESASSPAHDFNADGTSDILLRNTSSGASEIRSVSNNSVTSINAVGSLNSSYTIQGTGDFNADGTTDILWQRTDGLTFIWSINNNAQSSFTSLGYMPSGSTIEGTGDFNADGTSDVLWRRADGLTVIWSIDNNIVTGFTSLGYLPAGSTVGGTGDYNADGTSDILWRRADGLTVIWPISNNTRVSFASLGYMPLSFTIEGTGDFNADSTSDILWRRDDGLTVIWSIDNNIRTSFTSIGFLPVTSAIEGTGDYNADGTSDILWRRTDGLAVIWSIGNNSVSSFTSLGFLPMALEIQ